MFTLTSSLCLCLILIFAILFFPKTWAAESDESSKTEESQESNQEEKSSEKGKDSSDLIDAMEQMLDSPCEKYFFHAENDWDANEILDCHYVTHTHPRQQPRPQSQRSAAEKEQFHHLAIFNIKYDLDFQEAGDRCSVRLHDEWLLGEVPVQLDEYSYNRIWYERMCNPFSFLECIPFDQVRVKHKPVGIKKHQPKVNPHGTHKHPGALSDGHSHLSPENETKLDPKLDLEGNLERNRTEPLPTLEYNDTGRNTSFLHRWYIGGRGPGKGRHKSGPGALRVDPGKILGMPAAIPVNGYPLDGVCVCSAHDPLFPDRKRPKYGMDFVEDEMRLDWCVSRPGGLCGRIYFQPNIWPSQNFVISDHIGCPKRYKGVEYECVRWSLLSNIDGKPKEKWTKPYTYTATCEAKQEILAGAWRTNFNFVFLILVALLTFAF